MVSGARSPCSVTGCDVLQTMAQGGHIAAQPPNQTGPSFLPECWCSHLSCAQGREKHLLDFLFHTSFYLHTGLETFQYI